KEDLDVKGTFKDEGKSGRMIEGVIKERPYETPKSQEDEVTKRVRGIEHRPGMIAALAMCNKGGILVTLALSRISRNAEQALQIINYMNEKGAHIFCVKEKLDTRVKFAKMYFHFTSLFSELEVDAIKERVTAAMEYKKQIGEFCGRIP